jgi:branched-chain amino acid aminotransferase
MHDVYNADEAFVTGTGAEVVPAVSADGRTIGDGRPGPVTGKLVEAFRHMRTRDGAKVVYAGAV